MKKFFLAIICATIFLTGCGSDNVHRVGVIEYTNVTEDDFNQFYNEFTKSRKDNLTYEFTFFPNVNSLIAALQSGRVDSVSAYETVARYFVDTNPEFEYEIVSPPMTDVFCCAMREEDVALKKEFDDAISEMAADGTLSALVKTYIAEIHFRHAPPVIQLPEFYNKSMVKIGVTGDLPALDFIRPDGKPSGFNTALLAEISKRIEKNFVLVQIDGGARATALASGKVDVVFWAVTPEGSEILPPDFDKPPGAILTKPYFSDKLVLMKLRTGKNK
ncbi:MAG: transporter substrate-binding domain-containing protein [Selenomonadaceae bacterium]|nr:transporter substrate-binding domain-containing protein [Selenomonadaceae bacterium]